MFPMDYLTDFVSFLILSCLYGFAHSEPVCTPDYIKNENSKHSQGELLYPSAINTLHLCQAACESKFHLEFFDCLGVDFDPSTSRCWIISRSGIYGKIQSNMGVNHYTIVWNCQHCRYQPFPGRSSQRGSLQPYRDRDDCLRYCNPNPLDQSNPPCVSANVHSDLTCYHLSFIVNEVILDLNDTHYTRLGCDLSDKYPVAPGQTTPKLAYDISSTWKPVQSTIPHTTKISNTPVFSTAYISSTLNTSPVSVKVSALPATVTTVKTTIPPTVWSTTPGWSSITSIFPSLQTTTPKPTSPVATPNPTSTVATPKLTSSVATQTPTLPVATPKLTSSVATQKPTLPVATPKLTLSVATQKPTSPVVTTKPTSPIATPKPTPLPTSPTPSQTPKPTVKPTVQPTPAITPKVEPTTQPIKKPTSRTPDVSTLQTDDIDSANYSTDFPVNNNENSVQSSMGYRYLVNNLHWIVPCIVLSILLGLSILILFVIFYKRSKAQKAKQNRSTISEELPPYQLESFVVGEPVTALPVVGNTALSYSEVFDVFGEAMAVSDTVDFTKDVALDITMGSDDLEDVKRFDSLSTLCKDDGAETDSQSIIGKDDGKETNS